MITMIYQRLLNHSVSGISLFLLLLIYVVNVSSALKGQCSLDIPWQVSSNTNLHPKDPSKTNLAILTMEEIRVEPIVRSPLLVIGSESFYMIPNTLASYRLALELGADYIHVKLCVSKDGVLVVSPHYDLNQTTNVATVFPDRSRIIDDESAYYIQDFTLDELKQLHVISNDDYSTRSRYLNQTAQIPTLLETMQMLQEWNQNTRTLLTNVDLEEVSRQAGLYVELMYVNFFKSDSNLLLGDIFLDFLKNNTIAQQTIFSNSTRESCDESNGLYQVPPLVIQSYDSTLLTHLQTVFREDAKVFEEFLIEKNTNDTIPDNSTYHGITPPLVYMVSDKMCLDEQFWFRVREINPAAISTDKRCLVSNDESKRISAEEFMTRSRENEIVVHVRVQSPELENIENDAFANAEEELRHLFCIMNIHGVFAENVDLAVRVGSRGCDDFREFVNVGDNTIVEETLDGKKGNLENITKDNEGVKPNYDAVNLCQAEQNSSSTQIVLVGIGFAFLGLLVGSVITYWLCSLSKPKPQYNRSLDYKVTLNEEGTGTEIL